MQLFLPLLFLLVVGKLLGAIVLALHVTLHFLVYCQSACAFILFASVLYGHLFLWSVLLHIPHVRKCHLALRAHFQDFVLLVVLWSGDF